jgi:hypothetical protein
VRRISPAPPPCERRQLVKQISVAETDQVQLNDHSKLKQFKKLQAAIFKRLHAIRGTTNMAISANSAQFIWQL